MRHIKLRLTYLLMCFFVIWSKKQEFFSLSGGHTWQKCQECQRVDTPDISVHPVEGANEGTMNSSVFLVPEITSNVSSGTLNFNHTISCLPLAWLIFRDSLLKNWMREPVLFWRISSGFTLPFLQNAEVKSQPAQAQPDTPKPPSK